MYEWISYISLIITTKGNFTCWLVLPAPYTLSPPYTLYSSAGSCYHLLVSQVLWNSLVRCWADKVYLPPLSHRFWKLTLQLISRYSKFLTEVQPPTWQSNLSTIILMLVCIVSIDSVIPLLI